MSDSVYVSRHLSRYHARCALRRLQADDPNGTYEIWRRMFGLYGWEIRREITPEPSLNVRKVPGRKPTVKKRK